MQELQGTALIILGVALFAISLDAAGISLSIWGSLTCLSILGGYSFFGYHFLFRKPVMTENDLEDFDLDLE